jgi:Beta-propeller repeat
MRIVGADPVAQVTGVGELPGKVNYLLGKDPTHWRTHIPTYAQVQYHNIYPGVDLIFSGGQHQLAYTFIVAPGADPRNIAMAFDEPSEPAAGPALQIEGNGSLRLRATAHGLRSHRPRAFQEVDGVRQEIVGSYVLHGPSSEQGGSGSQNRVGVQIDAYDATKHLVIQSELDYSTYLGGSDADLGIGIAVDASGHAYVTGNTASPDFPDASETARAIPDSSGDVFVTKLHASGAGLIYSTFIGGSGFDTGASIAVDALGQVYVTGRTASTDFPAMPNAFQAEFGGGSEAVFSDGFIAKIDAEGSGLLYASYLGGSDGDVGTGIAVDASGHAYVAGETFSTDFPTTPTSPQPTFGGNFTDGFVAKVSADGSALLYASYLGGSGEDAGRGIAVDTAGYAYVAGDTDSDDFPRPEVLHGSRPGGSDAFVAKVNAEGSALIYVAHVGGSDSEFAGGVALDASSHAYLTGQTFSLDFPVTPGVLQPEFGGGFLDAFVAKVTPDGAGLIYASYLGGDGDDVGSGLAVDASGHAYVTGLTESTDFPTVAPVQQEFGGAFDVLISKIKPDGSALVYSTYVGGSAGDRGFAIAVGPAGRVYVTGLTESTDFPLRRPLQRFFGGTFDAFIVRITEAPQESCLGSGEAWLAGRVKVVSTHGVAPIQDVTLTLDGLNGCRDVTATGARGFYAFRDLEGGTYTVTPDKAGCTFHPPLQQVNLAKRTAGVRFTGRCP